MLHNNVADAGKTTQAFNTIDFKGNMLINFDVKANSFSSRKGIFLSYSNGL